MSYQTSETIDRPTYAVTEVDPANLGFSNITDFLKQVSESAFTGPQREAVVLVNLSNLQESDIARFDGEIDIKATSDLPIIMFGSEGDNINQQRVINAVGSKLNSLNNAGIKCKHVPNIHDFGQVAAVLNGASYPGFILEL